mmetsp:Transcript_24637/g.40434  ORF Transcript_24637/g.40434 Transcript_24637/m.40434 type:complete len:445 (-) Transcript_24637:101-1435(-)
MLLLQTLRQSLIFQRYIALALIILAIVQLEVFLFPTSIRSAPTAVEDDTLHQEVTTGRGLLKNELIIPANRVQTGLDEEVISLLSQLPPAHTFPSLPNTGCCAASITETRHDKQMNDVLLNMHQNLPGEWDMLIRCPIGSEEKFKALPALQEIAQERSIRVLPLRGLGSDSTLTNYNPLAMTPNYWLPLRSYDRVLNFERDSVMCGPRKNNSIVDFLKYDYVGAPWVAIKGSNTFNAVSVGNGGFSLRNPKWMIHCAQLLLIGEAHQFFSTSEDVFFANCLAKFGAHLPSPSEAGHFALERWGWPDTLAVHQSQRFYLGNLESLALSPSRYGPDQQLYHDWGKTLEMVHSNIMAVCPPFELIAKELKAQLKARTTEKAQQQTTVIQYKSSSGWSKRPTSAKYYYKPVQKKTAMEQSSVALKQQRQPSQNTTTISSRVFSSVQSK